MLAASHLAGEPPADNHPAVSQTPCFARPPLLLLSAFHFLPPTFIHSFIHLHLVTRCSGPVNLQPCPILVPSFWSLLRPQAQPVLLHEGPLSATRVGGQACGPHPHGRSCSEGRWGRMSSLGPSQDTCPLHLSLASASHSYHCLLLTFQSRLNQAGSITLVPGLL